MTIETPYANISLQYALSGRIALFDNGNLTGDHRGYSYIYDYENRLIQVYIDDTPGGGYNAGDTNIAELTGACPGRRAGNAPQQKD